MPLIINCPQCQRQLRLPESYQGTQVKCPSCGSAFTAPMAEEAQPPPTTVPPFPVQPPPPPPAFPSVGEVGRSAAPPWQEPDARHYDQQEAAQLVAGPGTALLVVGIIELSLGLIMIVVNCLGMAVMLDKGGPGRPGPDPMFQVVGGILGCILAIVRGGLIIAGALQYKNLTGYGMAMTGAITAVVPCNCCFIINIGFGIWALVVLNNPVVRNAFRS
jgi:hypothetical protein